jgi:hypothetical protein
VCGNWDKMFLLLCLALPMLEPSLILNLYVADDLTTFDKSGDYGVGRNFGNSISQSPLNTKC